MIIHVDDSDRPLKWAWSLACTPIMLDLFATTRGILELCSMLILL